MSKTVKWLLMPFAVMFAGAMTEPMLPGIYMDGVYPDYVVARFFTDNPSNVEPWIVIGNFLFDRFPLLGNVYFGTLPFWLGLPFYSFFGTDVLGIRITHAVFACMVMGSAWWMLRVLRVRAGLAALVLSAMAIDPAFHFIFRSQFYMLAVPAIFLFSSVALLWKQLSREAPINSRLLVLSGVAAGISAYGYFIYVFYVATLAIVVLFSRDRRIFVPWILGAALGYIPTIVGWICVLATGGMSSLFVISAQLQPFQENSSLVHKLTALPNLLWLAYSGQGLAAMILGEFLQVRLVTLKFLFLIAGPIITFVVLEIFRKPNRELRFMALMTIIPPIACILIFGTRLWVHHFTPTVLFLYCSAAVAYECFFSSQPWLVRGRPVLIVSFVALFFANAINFQEFIHQLKRTGGAAFFSDAINRFSWQAQKDNAVYFMPDWGLLFPFSMITRGHIKVITSFAPETIVQTLCGGQDVVVTAIGKDAKTLAAERTAAVNWPNGESNIWSQLNGVPVIYSVRWRATDRESRCQK